MANYGRDELEELAEIDDYVMPAKDTPLFIILDCGNTDVKIMIHGHFGREVWFPQCVRKVNKVDYRNLSVSYKRRPSDFEQTSIFEMNGQGFVIGQHAAQVGNGETRLGVDKYERDHIGACLVAGLLRLYPYGHNDIHLVVLHPAKVSDENLRRLGKAVSGDFNAVLPTADKVSYRVTDVIPLEEAVGAFQSFILTTQGRTYKNPRLELRPSRQFLIIDVGGYISSIVPGVITPRGRLEINRNGAMPVEVGIQTVTATLQPLLKSKFPRLDMLQNIPEDMLHYAVMTGTISISGDDPVDCSKEVSDAMQPLITELGRPYKSVFRAGIPYAGIIIGGGGGGAAFGHLCRRLLEHPHVFTAEKDTSKMRFSAIRGASKGLIPALMKQSDPLR